jgi:hypothetical protein
MSNLNGVASMSPDALLAYCRLQLHSLDQETSAQIQVQNTELDDRKAVEKVQSTLESFGTQGPQNGTQMANCVSAFDDAIQSLATDDPVRAQLDQQRATMISTYHYHAAENTSQTISSLARLVGANGDLGATAETSLIQMPALTTPTSDTPKDGQWAGTTGALSNLVTDIKSDADIRMLQLQDLVSERQQAVQLFTGMMSKTDQTLEDQSKAIGR